MNAKSATLKDGLSPASLAAARQMRWLLVLMILATLLVFLVAAWNHRNQSLARAQEQAEQTARLLEEHTQKLFAGVQANLREIAWLVATRGWDEIAGNPAIQAHLREISSAPEVESTWLADANGDVRFNTLFEQTPGVNVADRAYFRAQQQPGSGLFLGEIIHGRVHGKPFFPVSQRIEDEAGRFLGVAQISISPKYFLDFYATLARPGSAIALATPGGRLLAHYPVRQGAAAGELRYPPEFMARLSGKAGTFEADSPLSENRRVFSYRKLDQPQLFILLGNDVGTLARDWLLGVSLYAVFAGLALCVLVVFGWTAYQGSLALGRAHGALERRVAERTAELAESEQRMREAQQIAGLGRWEFDVSSGQVQWSDEVYEIFGRNPAQGPPDLSELRGLMHPDDLPQFDALLRAALEEGRDFETEWRVRRPDGTVRWKRTRARVRRGPNGEVARLIGIDFDITGRRAAEERLRANEDRLRVTVEGAELGTWDFDVAGGLFHCDAYCRSLFGFEGEDTLAYEAVLGRLHPEDRLQVARTVRAALDPAGDGRYAAEFRVPQADGGERWLLTRGRAFFQEGGRPPRFIGTIMDITRSRQAHESLRAAEEFTRRVLESSRDCIKVLDLQGRMLSINQFGLSAMEVADFDLVRNRSYLELWTGESGERAAAAVQQAAAGGVGRFIGFYRTPSGRETWWDEILTPVLGADGRPERLLAVARDITERRQAEERQALLMAELDHRVKNTLAAVLSVASQTLGAGEATAALAGRIAAMADAHGLLAQNRWEGAGLAGLLDAMLGPHADRVTLDGPEVQLSARVAQLLGMVIHELATNAAKYGALSTPEGRIAVAWRIEGDGIGQLVLEWAESGGPPVAQPSREGFGTKFLQHSLRYELHGSTRLEYRAAGLHCTLRLPLDRIVVPVRRDAETRPHAAARADGQSERTSLEAKRILLVEDAVLVAMQTEELLESAGCVPVGPAATVEEALALAESEPLDAALLDVNLDGDLVFPVAAALRRRAIPFIFVTGYDGPSVFPAEFQRDPRIGKPIQERAVLAALAEAVAGRLRAAPPAGPAAGPTAERNAAS